jgi:cell wall-associated NlpC family hydrolase
MSGIVTGAVVNLRKAADLNGEVLGKFPKDTRVTITGISGDWFQVTVGNLSGFMHSDYVLISEQMVLGASSKADELLDYAYDYLGVAYKAGGDSPAGFDCSGFTMYVFSKFGVKLTHSATVQSTEGTPVKKAELVPGDLVFFDNERGKITHVGMILSRGLVIHASGRVRIDTIDHQGIYKPEKKGYSHKLRLIRRIA